jgi:hypothetical protein
MLPIQKNAQCLLRAPSLGLPVQSMSKVPDWQCLTVYSIDFIGRRLLGNWGKLIAENSNEISRQILITDYWREFYEEAATEQVPVVPGKNGLSLAVPLARKSRRGLIHASTNRDGPGDACRPATSGGQPSTCRTSRNSRRFPDKLLGSAVADKGHA